MSHIPFHQPITSTLVKRYNLDSFKVTITNITPYAAKQMNKNPSGHIHFLALQITMPDFHRVQMLTHPQH